MQLGPLRFRLVHIDIGKPILETFSIWVGVSNRLYTGFFADPQHDFLENNTDSETDVLR